MLLISCKFVALTALFALRAETAPGLTNKELIAEAIHGVFGEVEHGDPLVVGEGGDFKRIHNDIAKAKPGDSLIVVERTNSSAPESGVISSSVPAESLLVVESTDPTTVEEEVAELPQEDSLLIIEVPSSAASEGISSIPSSVTIVKQTNSTTHEDHVADSAAGEPALIVEKKKVTAVHGGISESSPAESLIIVEDSSSPPLLFDLGEPDYVALEVSPPEPVAIIPLAALKNSTAANTTDPKVAIEDRQESSSKNVRRELGDAIYTDYEYTYEEETAPAEESYYEDGSHVDLDIVEYSA